MRRASIEALQPLLARRSPHCGTACGWGRGALCASTVVGQHEVPNTMSATAFLCGAGAASCVLLAHAALSNRASHPALPGTEEPSGPAVPATDTAKMPGSDLRRTSTISRMIKEREERSLQASIHVVVLTGGPCAGKSTAQSRIKTRFEEMGYSVYFVPEMATLTIAAGTNVGQMFELGRREQIVHWQLCLAKLQIYMEGIFLKIAKDDGKRSIIVCDRGVMDNKGYMENEEEWAYILDELGQSETQLRDQRYDGVIHMQTAAVGTTFYTQENNDARMETAAEAVHRDQLTLSAWNGHHNLNVIDNKLDESFGDKMRRVEEAMSRIVGAVPPKISKRKLLVEFKADVGSDPLKDLGVGCEKFILTQTFLTASDQTSASEGITAERYKFGALITKKQQGKAVTYMFANRGKANSRDTQKRNVKQVETVIPVRTYRKLLRQADPECNVIQKERRAFIWKYRYYTLDEYLEPEAAAGKFVLTVELDEAEEVSNILPPFLSVVGDVTHNHFFKVQKENEKS